MIENRHIAEDIARLNAIIDAKDGRNLIEFLTMECRRLGALLALASGDDQDARRELVISACEAVELSAAEAGALADVIYAADAAIKKTIKPKPRRRK